jgi:hypothetical protein
MLSSNITESILNIIKGITSTQIFQFGFWFHSAPTSLASVLLPFVVFVSITLFGISIIFYNRWKVGKYPPKNKIFKPLAAGLIIIGIFGLVFTALNWQGISFLGVRIFLLAIFLAALAWFIFFLYLLKKKVPDQTVRYETGLIKRRYFSKKKT